MRLITVSRLAVAIVALCTTLWVLAHMVLVYLNSSWTIRESNIAVLISEIVICIVIAIFALSMIVIELLRRGR